MSRAECRECSPAHNCARDGHVASQELAPMMVGNRIRHRVFLCGRCGETFRLDGCPKCQRAVALVKGRVAVATETPGEARASRRSGASIV